VWVAGIPGYSETTQTDGSWTVHNHPTDPWSNCMSLKTRAIAIGSGISDQCNGRTRSGITSAHWSLVLTGWPNSRQRKDLGSVL